MRKRPRIVKNLDFDSDPVMKDLRENFNEEEILNTPEKGRSDLVKQILIIILVIIAALYILARLRL